MILSLEEKTGGTKWLDQDNGKFRALIDQLNLVDIETRNGIFTWSNHRSGHQQVACRLDRFLISEALLLEDPTIEANILPKRLGPLARLALSGCRINAQTQTLQI
jgi:hypothetical protein